jgi:hypothetical protein
MKQIALTIVSLILALPPAFGQPTDLLSGVPVVNDLANYPLTFVARPEPGEAVTDPQFGVTIRRITDAREFARRAVVPMYTGTQPWNADESLLLLYAPGQGHQLYLGQPPYSYLGQLNLPGEWAPTDLENIHWDVDDPHVFRYPAYNKRLVEVNLAGTTSGEILRIRHDFTDLCGTSKHKLLMEPHTRPSWDDRYWGFGCAQDDGNKWIFAYDLEQDAVLWQYRIPTGPQANYNVPMVMPSGEYFIVWWADDMLVLDRQGRVVNVIADPEYSHLALGRVKTATVTADFYWKHAFDLPYPTRGTLIGYWIPFGYHYTYVGENRGFPYPKSGIHHSAISYHNPNWVWTSIIGYDVDGQSVLDNEILLVSALDGRVGRIAHHRSAKERNPNLVPAVQGYWQEPHIAVSPSGTRAIFASDWSVGLAPSQMYDTIETFVVELPVYREP